MNVLNIAWCVMISDKEFDKICKLAKLSVSDEKRAAFLEKFNCIFDWIDKLESVDVSDVKLGYDYDDVNCNSGRTEDVEVCDATHAEVLANAVDAKYGMYSVPKWLSNTWSFLCVALCVMDRMILLSERVKLAV